MVSLRAQFFSRVMRTSCRFPPGQAQSDSRARLGSSAAAYPQPALRKQGGHLVDLEYLDNILAGSHRTHIHGTKPRFLDFTLDGGGRLFRRARHQRRSRHTSAALISLYRYEDTGHRWWRPRTRHRLETFTKYSG